MVKMKTRLQKTTSGFTSLIVTRNPGTGSEINNKRLRIRSAAAPTEPADLSPGFEKKGRPIEKPLIARASESTSVVLTLIERVALDPRADIEKLEALIQMSQRLNAKEAELAFNAAKGRILKKLGSIKIVKTGSIPYEIRRRKSQLGICEIYKYTPLEEIDKHLRPLLVEENMDLSYSDEPLENGEILVRGRLKHLPSGYYEDSFMPAPRD